jgi:hypothetical protein
MVTKVLVFDFELFIGEHMLIATIAFSEPLEKY